jgi:8-oxo-dGTP pyrophosphatase MutT (NUDIX family)
VTGRARPQGLGEAIEVTQQYLARWPAESRDLSALVAQLRDDARVLERSNMVGHVTTSALVLDASLTRALLVHHRALDRWLQPGGHYEPPGSLWTSACREVAEETGITALEPFAGGSPPIVPLDIDTHAIPARPAKGEDAHRHHDFAYLAVAASCDGLAPQVEEVLAVRWLPLADLAAFPLARTRRLARKAQEAIARHGGNAGTRIE